MDRKERLVELAGWLERGRSYAWCIEVAHALGYGIGGEPEAIWLDIPTSPVYSLYFSLDALVEDLLESARQAIGLP